jgi:hypothetical protein
VVSTVSPDFSSCLNKSGLAFVRAYSTELLKLSFRDTAEWKVLIIDAHHQEEYQSPNFLTARNPHPQLIFGFRKCA